MNKVSVCMATYNGEKYIGAQISSIINQLAPHDELIVSDDSSCDKTLEVVRAFNDPRIKIIKNVHERGYSGNFENAIKQASGDFIFLADQDDVWLPRKMKIMLGALEKSDFVVCNAEFVDHELNPLGFTLFSLRGGRRGFINNLYKSRYLGACMAFKRSLLTRLLPFPDKRALCPHDLWISLISELYYRVAIVDEPLLLYRRHGKNVSGGGVVSENTFCKKLLFRAYSLLMVLSRYRR